MPESSFAHEIVRAVLCMVSESRNANLKESAQCFESTQWRFDGSVFRHRQHPEAAKTGRIDQAKHRRLRREVLLHGDARFLLHRDQLLTQSERGEEIALRRQTGRLQTGSLTRPSQRAEINMGGEILPTNSQKRIISYRMSGVPPHGSFQSMSAVELDGRVAVVDGKGISALE